MTLHHYIPIPKKGNVFAKDVQIGEYIYTTSGMAKVIKKEEYTANDGIYSFNTEHDYVVVNNVIASVYDGEITL